MYYYKAKLNRYSKKELSNEKLETTKQGILSALEEYYKSIMVELRLSSKAEFFGVGGTPDRDIEKECILVRNEIDFLKSLNTTDFYNYLVNYENYNLLQLENQSKVERDVYVKKIAKAQKANNIFSQRKIEKNTRKLSNVDSRLSYISGSRNELEGLSGDEKLAYIVGRFDVDKSVRFEIEDFERYNNAYNAALEASSKNPKE